MSRKPWSAETRARRAGLPAMPPTTRRRLALPSGYREALIKRNAYVESVGLWPERALKQRRASDA